MLSTQSLSFAVRAEQTSHPLSKQLLELMEEKKTNLVFNPDVKNSQEFLRLADLVGPEIAVLKTHIDLIEDFTPEFIEKLQQLSERYNFLIFEDRKFVDIGSVVKEQYQGGMYKIASWAHITNATPLAGPGIIQGLKEVGKAKSRGLLLLAEMSSKGALTSGFYTEENISLAKEHADFVMGFIAQQRLVSEEEYPGMIHMTPGVQLQEGGDALGQQYRTPHKAICEQSCDMIIVGRGILKAEDPKLAASEYRKAAWQAYQEKIA
ncbi:MAG: orotidine-5'-phosphate decarboxylase [Waddliaceae bacterium]|nr:orotidine-5'-phosphate decarboxylase [Waddliaceae bacterium]